MIEPDDRELNALLERRSDLASLYRHARVDEPPPHLDAAIRAAARRAVASQPGKTSQRERWVMPAAAAAALVVGVSLAVLMRESEPPVSSKTDVAARESRDYASKVNQATPATPEAPASGPRQVVRANADNSGDITVPQQKRRDADQTAAGNDSRQMPLAAERHRQDAPAAAAQPNSPALLETPPVSSPGKTATSAADVMDKDTSPRASAPAITAVGDGAAQLKREAESESKETVRGTVAATPAPARAPSENVARMEAKPKSMTESDASEAKKSLAKVRSPDEWLKDIDTLRRQGRLTEAARSLEEFRRQYPTYPIPSVKP